MSICILKISTMLQNEMEHIYDIACKLACVEMFVIK